jgi:hypothetical protein
MNEKVGLRNFRLLVAAVIAKGFWILFAVPYK